MARSALQLVRGERDESGVTIVEFGFAMPVMAVILMALFDVGFQVYAQSVIDGAVQEAARATTMEEGGPKTATLDAMVTRNVRTVIPGAQLAFTRKNYQNFSDVGEPEEFTDTAGSEDGICNDGEPFEDVNGNGSWDADRGSTGVGGARDAVLYGATASFDRVFPFPYMLGLPQTVTIGSSTVLRNQPYDEQGARDPVVGTCT